MRLTGSLRHVYTQPRRAGAAVTFIDVFNEVKEVMRKTLAGGTRLPVDGYQPNLYGSFSGAKFASKKVTRNYAFELADVPREPAAYMKVLLRL